MKKMSELEILSRLLLDFCCELKNRGQRHYQLNYLGKMDDPYYFPNIEIEFPQESNNNVLNLSLKDQEVFKSVTYKKDNKNSIYSANIDNSCFLGIQKKEIYVSFINGLFFEEIWYKNNKKEKGIKLIKSSLVGNKNNLALKEVDTVDLKYSKEKEVLDYSYYDHDDFITEHDEIDSDAANKVINKLILSRKNEIRTTFDEIKKELPNFYRIARNYKIFNNVDELLIKEEMKKEMKKMYRVKVKQKGSKIND